MIAALADDSWRVRKAAVDRAVRWHDAGEMARALVDVLAATDDVGARNAALEALERLGAPAVDALVAALEVDQPHRKFLLDALGGLADPRAVPALARGLDDPDPNVQVAAAEALGRIGGPAAEAALLACADRSSGMVQLTALDALAQAGAVVPATRALRWADVPVVRVSALRLLGNARDPAALPTLVAALGDRTRRAREAAIEALARYVDDGATDAQRALVARELRALGRPAVDHLIEALAARQPEVRRAAALLLGVGQHRAAVARLAELLGDPDAGAAAARAIDAMGPAGHRAAATAPDPAGDLSDADFAALAELLRARCGLQFERDAAYLLRRRLAPRLAAVGAASFRDYVRLLQHGPDRERELDAVIDAVTTNETYFFREAYQLRAFRDEILPTLRALRPRGDRLTVWSAGCSTGEEAYTIAMLIVDAGGFDDWDVRVIGTDISSRVLDVARAGRYTANSLRSSDLPELRRFLRRTDDGTWEVREAIRDLVVFHRLNLVDTRAVLRMPDCDVVFCRNVLIYLDRASRARVVASFYDRLTAGGYLLLGHSESLVNVTTAFEIETLRNDTVYRKVG